MASVTVGIGTPGEVRAEVEAKVKVEEVTKASGGAERETERHRRQALCWWPWTYLCWDGIVDCLLLLCAPDVCWPSMTPRSIA